MTLRHILLYNFLKKDGSWNEKRGSKQSIKLKKSLLYKLEQKTLRAISVLQIWPEKQKEWKHLNASPPKISIGQSLIFAGKTWLIYGWKRERGASWPL